MTAGPHNRSRCSGGSSRPTGPRPTSLQLYVYADASGSGRVVTQYRAIRFDAVPPMVVGLVSRPQVGPLPRITYERTGTTEAAVAVHDASRPFTLVFTETYSPD